jgi:hypothetical protein
VAITGDSAELALEVEIRSWARWGSSLEALVNAAEKPAGMVTPNS